VRGRWRASFETAPENPEQLWEELLGFRRRPHPPRTARRGAGGLRRHRRGLQDFPGRRRDAHDAYRHGLLEHTCTWPARAAPSCRLYASGRPTWRWPASFCNDIGKTIEYEGTLVTQRSRRGLPPGSRRLGYQLVRRRRPQGEARRRPASSASNTSSSATRGNSNTAPRSWRPRPRRCSCR